MTKLRLKFTGKVLCCEGCVFFTGCTCEWYANSPTEVHCDVGDEFNYIFVEESNDGQRNCSE